MLRFLRPVFLSLFVLALTLAPQMAKARPAPEGFSDLAEKLLPSVVNISTTQILSMNQNMPEFEFQFPPGSPFEEFFRQFKEQHQSQRGPQQRKQKTTSLGSGFIIDPAGYIVTNNHVIQDADEITVILHDDTNLTASVVGRDKKTDLAVLKVESKKPLQAVAFGDSDKARVGDWILAIGNPFGLGGTVTTGILSARARDINSGPYDDYLQTDAPINRGNSGGPMFNMDGEVIGINSAIFSPSGGSVGIGFAIPSSLAKPIIEQLKTTGTTRRGWLGVRIQLVTPDIAESLGLDKPRGALVSGVTADGPGAKAKIEVGDVIVAFDGKDVPEMQRLPRIVAETEVGKTVNLTVIRKGKDVSLKVKVGELQTADETEDEALPAKGVDSPAGTEKIEELGLSVAPMTDFLRKRHEIGKETSGVVVVGVAPNGLAADHGLQIGDAISEASQQDVKSGKDLAEIIKKAKKEGRPVLLLVERHGELRFIAMNPIKEKKK